MNRADRLAAKNRSVDARARQPEGCRALRAGIEVLEARRLLSAALEQGVWQVRGDGSGRRDDVIVIDLDASLLRATINGTEIQTTPATGVNAVVVDAGRGNDRVTIQLPTETAVAVVVFGGAGKDRLAGSGLAEQFFGGSGNDRIDCGGGADAADGQSGRDNIAGGDDNDTLRGSGGRDDLAGGWGNDDLDGGDGDDRLDGGDGDDHVAGGRGKDRLAGGAGTDMLDGGRGADSIFRQSGTDQIAAGPRGKPDGADKLGDEDVSTPAPRQSDPAEMRVWAVDAAVKQWSWAFDQPTAPYNYLAARDGTVFVAGGAEFTPTPAPAAPGSSPLAGDITGSAAAGGGDSSGTNTQEQGVDEADLVENDGQYIYSLEDDELVIASALPADDLRVVSRRALAADETPLGIYRHGNRLTMLTGTFFYHVLPLELGIIDGVAAQSIAPFPTDAHVKVTVLDVSNPAAPSVIEETKLDGSYDGSRLVGERLYVVVRNDTWVPVPIELPEDVYESEASYRSRLEAMPLEDLLPGYTSQAGGQSSAGALVSAGDAYVRNLADVQIGQNLTTLALLDVGDAAGGTAATSTVAGFGGSVYASADAFYLAGTQWDDAGEKTRLFKFAMAADQIPLVAQGDVQGSVLNQFAMDEEGDYFRIATNHWSDSAGPTSSLFVMTEVGDRLEVVGSVNNLAHGETLRSARFVGDKAYIVTFRQVDPLFVIDLSNPAKPSVAGELKIPGYSSYLHPVSDDLLIGLGRDIDPDSGADRGLQLSLFDVSHPSAPRRLASEKLSDQWVYSEAETDHHAFAYFPEQGVVALPVNRYTDGTFSQTLVVLKLDPSRGADAFEKLGEAHPPSGVRRSLRIGDVLYAIGSEHIQSMPLLNPATVLDMLGTDG